MGIRTKQQPTLKSREEVAQYSDHYSLSYEKSRAAAAREGRGFMRKKDFLALKRESMTGKVETRGSSVSWVRSGVEVEDEDIRAASTRSPVPEKLGYGHFWRYSAVKGTIGTRRVAGGKALIKTGEYRVSILSKERLDSHEARARLDRLMSRLAGTYSIGGLKHSLQSTRYELGERASSFQGEGTYGEYVNYDIKTSFNPMIGRHVVGGASVNSRKKFRYNSFMGHWENR